MPGGVSLPVVDDNAYMRTIIVTIARACGVHYVEEAASGADALERLTTRRFDAATVDLNMDPINGLEFLHFLRRGKDSPDIWLPVIVISAYAERSRVNAVRDAGGDEFLSKPVTAAALMKRRESVLHRRRPFIHTPTYVGPDRRRRVDANYRGPERRQDP